jgi:signal transduction histidine kinase
MQIQKTLRDAAQIQRYYQFNASFERECLGWLGILGCIYTAIFLVVDYWRAEQYLYLVIFRTVLLLVFAFSIWLSYRKSIEPATLHLLSFGIATIHFIFGFLLDYYAGVPNFFLGNYLCLYLYAFNTALGHPPRFKVAQTILLFLAYVIYIRTLSSHQAFHLSQQWNVLVNASLSLLMGILMERFRVHNFLQQKELFESAQKIEELNNLKTKLISILSHDLVAPMNSLRGLLQLNNDGLISSADFKNHSAKISDAVEGMVVLQTNLLRWSKLQLEGFRPVKTTVDVSKVVNQVIRSFHFSMNEKDITIKNEVISMELQTDEEVLKMLVRNFLSNGVKFSHPGGTVRVCSSVNASQFILSVEDEGAGMTQEQVDSIFKLEKKSSVGTKNEMGAGIGLVITNDFAKMIGSKISVKSTLGKGSAFSVNLPMHDDYTNSVAIA